MLCFLRYLAEEISRERTYSDEKNKSHDGFWNPTGSN